MLLLISFRALAASCVGTVQRTISQPAASRRRICSTVPLTSSVFVLVIDWIATGCSPPMITSPIRISFAFCLSIFFPISFPNIFMTQNSPVYPESSRYTKLSFLYIIIPTLSQTPSDPRIPVLSESILPVPGYSHRSLPLYRQRNQIQPMYHRIPVPPHCFHPDRV